MIDRRWSRVPQALLVPALAALAVAGCSSGGSTAHTATTTQPSTTGRTAHAEQSAYTASQLRDALLTEINGQRPAEPIESGPYGSLPAVKATRTAVRGVHDDPAKCAGISVTGLNSPAFADVPATVASFHVGQDGIDEVLLAPAPSTATTALGNGVPAGCARYRASMNGKTYVYTVTDHAAPHIGEAARVMSITASTTGSTHPVEVNVWSVVYRAPTFVGAVTIVGPDASRGVVETLAAQAYAHAAKTLH